MQGNAFRGVLIRSQSEFPSLCSAHSYRSFKAVVHAFTSPGYYYHWVRMPTGLQPHPTNLMNDSRFNPYLKDCIGAIDGTFIPCRVRAEDHPRYRCRKKTISMNVLACCTFDLRFCYVLAGWEGTANDHRVYREALASDLRIPKGRYFLGDAGYSPTAGTMTPYRGVKYHLKEWGRANLKPQSPTELFNLRHSSARNVIERIFGVIKNKFKILDRGCWFDIQTQAAVVLSLCALHNNLREYSDSELDIPEPFPSDWRITRGNLPANSHFQPTEEREDLEMREEERSMTSLEKKEKAAMLAKREEVAQGMWEGYQAFRLGRRLGFN